jgi:hypothetical protein
VENSLSLSPNPARDMLQVQTAKGMEGNMELTIMDASGKQVYQKRVNLLPGSNSIPVDISLLARGPYFIRLSDTRAVFTKPFIKE